MPFDGIFKWSMDVHNYTQGVAARRVELLNRSTSLTGRCSNTAQPLRVHLRGAFTVASVYARPASAGVRSLYGCAITYVSTVR